MVGGPGCGGLSTWAGTWFLLAMGRLRSCISLRKNMEKRWLLENMDGAFLVLDEIVDGG